MEVKSWLTGVRGVSLPFSDYCEPICDEHTAAAEFLAPVLTTARQRQWKFLEVRGGEALLCSVSPYTFYYRHTLGLHGNADEAFSRLRSNYRAKIRKALSRELTVTILRSAEAMAEYYRLHCLTRQRHGLPPQPAVFFQNIQQYIMANNSGFVALVAHQGKTVAGAVFFVCGQRAMYKFGASDIRSQHVYPTYVLFWHVIQWLVHNDYTDLCFGRSAPSNQGLIQFKDGWGTSKARINYYKYDLNTESFVQNATRSSEVSSIIGKKIPIALLKLAGSILYKHLG